MRQSKFHCGIRDIKELLAEEFKLVRIEWQDITGNTEPWYTIEDALELEPANMVTVGWLLSDEESFVIIAASLGDKREASDISCIPKKVISNIKELEMGSKGTCWAECSRCKSIEVIWVHGHSQCRMCGLVIDGCCGGEQQKECTVPEAIKKDEPENTR